MVLSACDSGMEDMKIRRTTSKPSQYFSMFIWGHSFLCAGSERYTHFCWPCESSDTLSLHAVRSVAGGVYWAMNVSVKGGKEMNVLVIVGIPRRQLSSHLKCSSTSSRCLRAPASGSWLRLSVQIYPYL